MGEAYRGATTEAFNLCIEAGWVSTLATQLPRIVRSDWPEFEIVWDAEVQEEFLREQERRGLVPVFTMEHPAQIIGRVRRPPEVSEDRRALLWCLAQCLRLMPDGWPLIACLPSSVRKCLPTSQLRQSFGRIGIRREDRQEFERSVELGIMIPAAFGLLSIYQRSVYAASHIEALCREMIQRATPYVGPSGSVLVVHLNDARSDEVSRAARLAVRKGDPSTVRRRVYESAAGTRELNQEQRKITLFALRSIGFTQRMIAEYWIETGMVKHEYGEDQLESALRQVRRLNSHFKSEWEQMVPFRRET